jgi:hypothetical protein
MASPHSRRQTTGAFGNNKPRDIKRDFTRPEPAPVDTTPREPNLADKFSQYAETLMEAATRDPQKTQTGAIKRAMQGALKIAQACWNAAVEGPEAIANTKLSLFAQLGHTITKEQLDLIIDEMVERKNTMFPGEKVLITNVLPDFKFNGPMRFRIQAVNINPEGVSKSDLSDLIGGNPA